MNHEKTREDKLREAAEEWRDIEDYPGYQVSNFGRVKSFKRGREKIIKVDSGSTGYLQIRLSRNNILSNKRVHRLVALAFIPNPENKPLVNHKDSNILNASVSNLEWCTLLENTKHAYEFGNKKTGSFSQQAKLTKEDVIKIFHSHLSEVKLSKIYGVSPTSIGHIKRKKIYKKETISEYKQSKTNSDATNNS